MEVIILGAGISGLSAGYHLNKTNKKAIIFEKNKSWGGLCDNFIINNYRFDYCVHLSFTKDKYVKKIFSNSSNYYSFKPPIIYNYYSGLWIKHPVQNNLFVLSVEDRIKIIRSFVQRNYKYENINPENYEEWLRCQYGDYFAENFPMKYTKKYWTLPAAELTTSWVGNRMHKTTIDEILFGAMCEHTNNAYYASEMRYPKKGGYKSFFKSITDNCNVKYNHEVIEINSSKKEIIFRNGYKTNYDILISSLPLPEIIKIIKNVPSKIKETSEKLLVASAHLISIGFNKPNIAKYLWFYVYDENILPARCYSPNLKSLDNVPKGCSSLQFEVYSSKYKPLKMTGDNLLNHIIEKGRKMGLFEINDIEITDYRKVEYGNVIFNHNIEKNRKVIHNYLDSIRIKYIGRFGEWDYLWSDQSFLSGKKVVEKMGGNR